MRDLSKPIYVCYAGAPYPPSSLELPSNCILVPHANYGIDSSPSFPPILSGAPRPLPPEHNVGLTPPPRPPTLRNWEPDGILGRSLLSGWTRLLRHPFSLLEGDIAYGADSGVDYAVSHGFDSPIGLIAHTLSPRRISFSYDYYPDKHIHGPLTWNPCTLYRTNRLLDFQSMTSLPAFQVISPMAQTSESSYAHPTSLPLTWWNRLRSSLHPSLSTLVFVSASSPSARSTLNHILLDFISFLQEAPTPKEPGHE